jgi:hypothetical protein
MESLPSGGIESWIWERTALPSCPVVLRWCYPTDPAIGVTEASVCVARPRACAILLRSQACASAIPAAASRRRVGGSAAGSGASALLSCSRLGTPSAGVMSPETTRACCPRPRRADQAPEVPTYPAIWGGSSCSFHVDPTR